MMVKKITDYAEYSLQLKKNSDNTLDAYMNCSPNQDTQCDGLVKTHEYGFTHQYARPLTFEELEYRLNKHHLTQLKKDGFVNLKVRSYFYERNQAFVSHKVGGEQIYPAFLFTVELDKNGEYKSKTFRSVNALEYSAHEAYNQTLDPNKKANNKKMAASNENKPTTTTVNTQSEKSIAFELAYAILEKYKKIKIDGTTIEIPVGENSGN